MLNGMLLTLDLTDWPLYLGIFLVAVAFAHVTYIVLTWCIDRWRWNQQDKKDRTKAFVEWQQTLVAQNDQMRHTLQGNLTRELQLLEERKILLARNRQITEALKEDFDKRRTQVFRAQAHKFGLNPTIEVTEEELLAMDRDKAAE
jgi:nitrogen fixation protein FixH